ncbi:hypothetical protein PMAYCL1PPCAC_09778, partial [Pristionchus mayeri]
LVSVRTSALTTRRDAPLPDSDPMAPHSPFVFLFVYLTLSVAISNAVIIEEQWIAVKDFFAKLKSYISEGPATTTTTTTTTAAPRFFPRGTRSPIRMQASRMHLNSKFRGEGCEVYFRVHSTQALLAENENVYEPLTYESGACTHSCYRDKYTGQWICCKPSMTEPLELVYYRDGSTELRMRSVDNAAVIACAFS